MLGYEFVEAVATAVKESPDVTLADTENAVNLVWGVSTQPDTIVVQTHEGDVFQIHISRLDVEDNDAETQASVESHELSLAARDDLP